MSRHSVRLWCAATAGVALAGIGLAGPATAAGANGGRGAAAGSGARGASAAPAATISTAGVISTVAGGVGGPGPGRSVAITPCGLKAAGASLYIGTGSALRRENVTTGALTTVAGNNAAGPTGDGGAATATAVGACGAALDKAGNLAIADGQMVKLLAAKTGTFYGQHMVARHIYTVAGTPGASRFPPDTEGWDGMPIGDGGRATRALLGGAEDVTFDRSGNMLIADSGLGLECYGCTEVGALLRVVAARTGTFYGLKMKAGDIYSVAGRQVGPGLEAYGGPAGRTWLGPRLSSVALDRSGNVILAGSDEPGPGAANQFVWVIAKATGRFYGQKMNPGHIYNVAGEVNGGPTRNAVLGTRTALWEAGGAVADMSGNLVIADGPEVRVVAGRSGRFYRQNMRAGFIYRIAGSPTGGTSGDGGHALRARVEASSIGLDRAGNVVLADANDNRVRVIAAKTGLFYGQKMTVGDIYIVAGNGSQFSGSAGPPLRAEFSDIGGVSVSAGGDVAFVPTVPFFLFPPASSSSPELIPARSGTFFGKKMTAGMLYMIAVHGPTSGFSGDAPMAFDHGGNLVLADANDNEVWLVAATAGTFYGQAMKAGGTYGIAGDGQSGFSGDGGNAVDATLSAPDAAAVDQDGNVLIVDFRNNRIRVLAAANGTFYGQAMTAGDLYTVAGDGQSAYGGDGTPATATGMNPVAVATDAAGNLIVTDGSQRVLAVAAGDGTFYGQQMTAGDVYTIAGDGTSGFSGSGGPALMAEFGALGGVTVDRSGNVIVTDTGNNVVWAVAASNGTFYGQPMVAGDSYVVGGGGTAILGDGGPATHAKLGPVDVATSAAGALLVTDGADNRLRAITP